MGVACSEKAHHDVSADSQQALVAEGNAKILESRSVQTELNSKYHVFIASEPKIVNNKVIHTKDFATAYNWRVLTKEQRRDVQGKLAHYLVLINRVLEIDAQKNITIDQRDQVLESRDSAQAFQKAIESFEQVYGENFNPRPGSSPGSALPLGQAGVDI